MATILTPREMLVDKAGNITRGWWRFLNSLNSDAGALSKPVVIPPNNILVAGDITAGSTVEIADLPANSFLGNSADVPAQPAPQTVAPSLFFDNGTLAAGNLAPLSLSGNPASTAGPPQSIAVGSNLSMDNGVLNAGAGGGGSLINFGQVVAIASWAP